MTHSLGSGWSQESTHTRKPKLSLTSKRPGFGSPCGGTDLCTRGMSQSQGPPQWCILAEPALGGGVDVPSEAGLKQCTPSGTPFPTSRDWALHRFSVPRTCTSSSRKYLSTMRTHVWPVCAQAALFPVRPRGTGSEPVLSLPLCSSPNLERGQDDSALRPQGVFSEELEHAKCSAWRRACLLSACAHSRGGLNLWPTVPPVPL